MHQQEVVGPFVPLEVDDALRCTPACVGHAALLAFEANLPSVQKSDRSSRCLHRLLWKDKDIGHTLRWTLAQQGIYCVSLPSAESDN